MFTKTQTFLKIFGARGKKCHFRTFSLIFPFIGAFARKNVSVWGERHPPPEPEFRGRNFPQSRSRGRKRLPPNIREKGQKRGISAAP